MAFSVTPTSGNQPYVLNATFNSKIAFSTGLYSLNVYKSVGTGGCPLPSVTVESMPAIADALLANGTFTATDSVLTGYCRVYNLVIRAVATGDILGQSNVSVNNVV